MRTCPKCGYPAGDEDRFCLKCFTLLQWTQESKPAGTRVSDPIGLVSGKGIRPVPVFPAVRSRMTYGNSSPLSKERALEVMKRAVETIDSFVDANPGDIQFSSMRDGLGAISERIMAGDMSPLSTQERSVISLTADFLIKAIEVLEERCDESAFRIKIDEWMKAVEGLADLISSGLQSAPAKAAPASRTVWDSSVKAEIKALEDDMGKNAPTLKIHPYDHRRNYWSDLDDLIGLESVKSCISDHIASYQVHSIRKRLHPSLKDEFKFNCIFKGKPGTGKTTVARILAGILKEEGVIKGGHCIETDISTLTSGWVGFTSKCTRLAALKAIGGVLFIDEAYTLASKDDKKSLGDEVIDTLTPIMSNYADNLVVVIAGYDKEMEIMLKSINPGFASRFQKSISFDDYSCTDMFEIFMNIAEKNCYRLDKGAMQRLIKLLKIIETRKEENHSFANARTAHSLFEAVRNKASKRFLADKSADPDLIIADDIALSRQELESIGAI